MAQPAGESFDTERFRSTNAVQFIPPWSVNDIEWWKRHMLEPFGLYPSDLAQALSASSDAARICTFSDLDIISNTFVIRVVGEDKIEGALWWHQRRLDLTGRLFEAQRMVVKPEARGKGIGRSLMADLIDTARRLDLKKITIEAEDIGRYVWVRMGFLPDRGSWRALRPEAMMRLAKSLPQLTPATARDLMTLVNNDDPAAIRALASFNENVDSTQLFDEFGQPEKVPIGQALLLEHGVNWFGEFDLEDDVSLAVFREYAGR